MPAFYTHYAVARDGFLQLPTECQKTISRCLPLYFFGAQGGDFCFFYPCARPSANLGRLLHKDGYDFFKILATFSVNEMAFAYAMGYLSHYAADTTFHPYVYYLSGKSLLKHSNVEARLDQFFKTKVQNRPDRDPFFSSAKERLSPEQLNELFLLYSAFAAKREMPPLSKSAFFRSISLFNAYMGASFAIFKRNLYPISDKELLNTNRTPWQHPKSPTVYSDEGVSELYDRALTEFSVCANSFLHSVSQKINPPWSIFGKNFLSGLL